MKVSIAMVMSADGKTTAGDATGTNHWSSPEDWDFFKRLMREYDCLVMGSATYEAARAIIKPSPDKPRVILTTNPEKYENEADTPGLVFSADEPKKLLESLAAGGYQKILVAGGATTNSRFLDAGVVDDMYITVEPLLFGSGAPLVGPLKEHKKLRLAGYEKLNEQGTVLLNYRIERNEAE